MDETKIQNASKYEIQNLTRKKIKSEPNPPSEVPCTPAHWEDIDLAAKSDYLQRTLSKDPNNIRSKFRYEDYLDSGAEPDLYKLVLENLDMVPNIGKTKDTMEHYWLKETILRSLERQGKDETYYDPKGKEVASLRGKKGPWAIADWAKSYLTKSMQTKHTNSNPGQVAYNYKNKNEFGSLETPNNDLVGDVHESNILAQDTSNMIDSMGEKNTLETELGSLETPNNDLVGDIRDSNILAQDTSNMIDSFGEKNILENEFRSLETPNNDMVDNSCESITLAQDKSNIIDLPGDRNILEISNDFYNEQTPSRDIQTEPASTTMDEEKSNKIFSDLRDIDVPSVHLTQNDLSTTLQPVKKDSERNRITEIDYSISNRRMKNENVRLSTHYKTLNEIGIKYMTYLNEVANKVRLGQTDHPAFQLLDKSRNNRTGDDSANKSKNTHLGLNTNRDISQIWEKNRLRYEFLGEKSPFAKEPPDPQFLIDTYGRKNKQQRYLNRVNENKKQYEDIYQNQGEQNELYVPYRKYGSTAQSDSSRLYPDEQYQYTQYYPQQPHHLSQINYVKSKPQQDINPYFTDPRNVFPNTHPWRYYTEDEKPQVHENYSVMQYGQRKSVPRDFTTSSPYIDSNSVPEEFVRERRQEDYRPNPYEQRLEGSTHNESLPSRPILTPRNYHQMPYGQYKSMNEIQDAPQRYIHPQIDYYTNNSYEVIEPYKQSGDVYENIAMPYNSKEGKHFRNPYLRDIQNDQVTSQNLNSHPNKNIANNLNYQMQSHVYQNPYNPAPSYYDPNYAWNQKNPYNTPGYWQGRRHQLEYSPNPEFGINSPPMGHIPTDYQQLDRLRQEEDLKYPPRNWYPRPFGNRNEDQKHIPQKPVIRP